MAVTDFLPAILLAAVRGTWSEKGWEPQCLIKLFQQQHKRNLATFLQECNALLYYCMLCATCKHNCK